MWFVPPLSCTSIETVETIPQIRDAAGANWNDTYVLIIAPATASVTITDQNNTTPSAGLPFVKPPVLKDFPNAASPLLTSPLA